MRGSISHEMRKEYCKRTTSHLRKERKVKDIIYLLGLPFSIVLIINYGYDSLTYSLVKKGDTRHIINSK